MITMKKLALILLLPAMMMVSCKKDTAKCAYHDSSAVATSTEIRTIQDYLLANSLTATQHASGVFYSIGTAGSGPVPSVCSYISVEYTGALFSGQVFDGTVPGTPANFTLGSLILGWQRALPVIQEGGSVTLYIPPSLAYGNREIRDNNGAVIIPANSYLKFTIELRDVQ
jgi:FKBP-type peptidyl-prolyl cis-trans isomerase FkpA